MYLPKNLGEWGGSWKAIVLNKHLLNFYLVFFNILCCCFSLIWGGAYLVELQPLCQQTSWKYFSLRNRNYPTNDILYFIYDFNLCPNQALTSSDLQLRVKSGWVVNLKVGLSGTLGSGSDKFFEVNWSSLKYQRLGLDFLCI